MSKSVHGALDERKPHRAFLIHPGSAFPAYRHRPTLLRIISQVDVAPVGLRTICCSRYRAKSVRQCRHISSPSPPHSNLHTPAGEPPPYRPAHSGDVASTPKASWKTSRRLERSISCLQSFRKNMPTAALRVPHTRRPQATDVNRLTPDCCPGSSQDDESRRPLIR